MNPGDQVRVKGRAGVWTVVRDTPGDLVIIRHGREHTSAPRTNITPATTPQTKQRKGGRP